MTDQTKGSSATSGEAVTQAELWDAIHQYVSDYGDQFREPPTTGAGKRCNASRDELDAVISRLFATATTPAPQAVAAGADLAAIPRDFANHLYDRLCKAQMFDWASQLRKYLESSAALSQPAVERGAAGSTIDSPKFRALLHAHKTARSGYEIEGTFMELVAHIEQARRIAAPVGEAVRDGWLPIETAPKGAKGIAWMQLAWGPDGDQSVGDGMRIGEKFYASGTFYCMGKEKPFEFREIEVSPTHWMPRAAAPIPAEPSADPMDWPLPCDVTVGPGTHRKGTKLRTLVARMQRLHEEAYGANPTAGKEAAGVALPTDDDSLWHIAWVVSKLAGGNLFNVSQRECVTEIRASFMDPDSARAYRAAANEPTAHTNTIDGQALGQVLDEKFPKKGAGNGN